MTISANFNPTTGLLSVFGDGGKNAIKISRNAAGKIFLNGGTADITGGVPTVANTDLIQVLGQDGDDSISIDDTKGALPAVDLFGGNGNDTIIGGSGADELLGGDGNDVLFGKAGNDELFGGAGNDTLTGGAGSDQVFGEDGDDTMIWNAGDGSDVFEGGAGNDTAQVNGSNAAGAFSITANGTRVRLNGIDPTSFSLDIGTTENLVLHAGGGDDVITASNGLSALIHLTLDGGDGNDTITGGDGADTLLGGNGNDVVDGGRGNDTALLGAGNDTFVWNPGDGSDTVDGQSGLDTLLFNGANINENITISANGSRVRLTRDVANISMDLNSIEQIHVNALGGADHITVNDLSGTGTKAVVVDLGSPAGTGIGDGQADTVTINGRAQNDHITISGSSGTLSVTGLPESVTITGAEGANDSVVVNGLAGDDHIDASTLAAGVAHLTIDGGDGNDNIVGSAGDDVLIGGAGNDVVTGGRGNDVALLGDGDDKFIWNPGDGSDTVEGQAGLDTLVFNGSNANENIDISANGSRIRFFRDVGNVTMDLNSIEHIQFNALGGADTVVVNDLSGTGVTQVAIDLAATGSTTGDGQPDQVVVNGTASGADTIKLSANGSTVVVNGLSEQVKITHVEAANDTVTVNGLGGNDVIDASAIAGGHVNLVLNGGQGDDKITGSQGNDTVDGGSGNDTALLGKGDDTYVWNPGDGSDTIDGQSGFDTLLFNGANVSEKIDISANGSHARLTRDVASISMDLNSIERVQLNTLGGADTITVDDLAGTGVQQMAISLGVTAGSSQGDGQPDTVVINGTAGDDTISVTSSNGVITVSGLATTVTITGFDAMDRLVINGLGGNDAIDASGLNATMQLTEDGGDGDDVLIGSSGNDILLGGAGNDVLIGGPGQDILDGGTGDNVLVQSPRSSVTAQQAVVPSSQFEGTNGSDHIIAASVGNNVQITGPGGPQTIDPTAGKPISIDGLAGDDVINASGQSSSTVQFILNGGDGNDVLHGGAGNDLLTGGGGADRFAFSGFDGIDTITDFQPGVDMIEVSGYGRSLASFGDLSGHISQAGSDVVIDLGAKSAGAGMIVLQHTQMGAISAANFKFS
jgi:Ca2+-binding RTX toxin-like protein